METKAFGPYRTIGMTYVAGNGNFDFPGVWERFMKRIKGTVNTEGVNYFGVCRCIPGVKDGTWEYVAAVEVPSDAKVLTGLVEVQIPKAEYVVMEVPSLKEIGAAWGNVQKAVAASGREPYCGAKGCECATHPGFEYYPAEFPRTGKLAIYVPVK